MTDEDIKVVRELIKPIAETLEVIANKVNNLDNKEFATSSTVQFIREQQSVMNEKLTSIQKTQEEQGKTLEQHTQKLDALLLDVMQLQTTAKGVWG